MTPRARSIVRRLIAFGTLPVVGVMPSAFAAQPAMRCDTALMRRAVGVQGYGQYGDRCEGVFRENVAAGATLWLASFTETFDPIDPRTARSLRVSWPVAVAGDVRISARSVRRNLYYAMDTWRPPGDTAWQWPTTILDGQGIHRDDIGVLASTTWRFRDTSATVYLPVSIRSSRRTADTVVVYSLTLYPNEPLDSVFLTVARIGPDGRAQAFLKRDEPVPQAFFFAERPVIVAIRDPGPTGVYSIRVSARYAGGKILTINPILVHHVSRRPPGAGGRQPD